MTITYTIEGVTDRVFYASIKPTWSVHEVLEYCAAKAYYGHGGDPEAWPLTIRFEMGGKTYEGEATYYMAPHFETQALREVPARAAGKKKPVTGGATHD